MTKREDREEISAAPPEPRRKAISSRFAQLPGEERPRDAVNRKPVVIEVEERGRRIERHLPPTRLIAETREAVRPRMEERYPCGAALRGCGVEVVHAAQNLRAVVAKRRAKHPAAG